MGSTRLRGKTLLDVAGRPMLARLVERLRQARTVDRIVVAATVADEDASLEAYARAQGLGIYRGSVDDIASRMLGTAEAFGADIVVRVWGDSPLIDPEIVDSAVSLMQSESLDHVCTFFPQRSFPAGFDVDVYRTATLRRISEETTDRFFREFPFEFVHRHSELRHATLCHTPDLSALELAVDYGADLTLVRNIFERLGADSAFRLPDVLALLAQDPSLAAGRERLARNPEYKQELLARAVRGERGASGYGHDPITLSGDQ